MAEKKVDELKLESKMALDLENLALKEDGFVPEATKVRFRYFLCSSTVSRYLSDIGIS